jgi:3-deoxy-D-manno-octulosonic-acid transferase
LGDTVGELATLYAAGDVAFVGGSLVPVGGHNLLEPAALGLPLLTGPYHFNSAEVARLLLERGAALEVADAEALMLKLRELLGDAAAGERRRMGGLGLEIIEANRGSVGRLLEIVGSWVGEARPSARS